MSKNEKPLIDTKKINELMERLYGDISIEAAPRRENYNFSGDFQLMTNGTNGFLTEYNFFKKKEDEYPEVLIWVLRRSAQENAELFAISKEGKYKIETFKASVSDEKLEKKFHLEYS